MAVVFGQEQSGLSNEELQLCNYLVNIPRNPDFTSLNLAAAVQIIAYEIWIASQQQQQIKETTISELATANEIAKFYEHLEQTMRDIEFFGPKHSQKFMLKVYRLFNRTRLEKDELDILHGILTAAQKKCRSA